MKKAKIEVFKAGRYGDTEGRIWSAEEVQQLADNYDPAYRNAPVILGHNDWNGEKPAYGWAESFEVNERGVLVANIEYNDDLEELVKKKMYTRVSIEATKKIELYDNFEGKQGAYVLAVALLGGSQPAVSGLQPVQFSAEDAKYAESLENDVESFSIDANIEETNDTEEPKTDEQSVENGGEQTSESSDTITDEVDGYSTENKNKEFDVTPEELEKFKAEKEAFEKEQARIKAEKEAFEKEREAFLAEKRKESISAFIAENDKKIVPSVKEDTQAFMETLSDEQLEAYKKIITAMPDAEIFENMEDSKNKDEHIDTDEKFQKQAEADLMAVKK